MLIRQKKNAQAKDSTADSQAGQQTQMFKYDGKTSLAWEPQKTEAEIMN